MVLLRIVHTEDKTKSQLKRCHGSTNSPIFCTVFNEQVKSNVFGINNIPFVGIEPPGQNIKVYENTPVGTVLFSITATDIDGPLPLVISAANDETRRLVNIGPSVSQAPYHWKAAVTLKASLDRDRSPFKRQLLIAVSDGSLEIPASLSLIIQDVNDNPPSFIHLPCMIQIPEGSNMVSQSVFVASATDPDTGPGGAVLYSMTTADARYDDTFKILNNKFGNITLTQPLDYETTSYFVYQIFAKDRGYPQCPGPNCKCSQTTEPHIDCAGVPALFIVLVTDIQDTPPVFLHHPMVVTVPENIQPAGNVRQMTYLTTYPTGQGTFVYKISAHDGDRGDPNAITYSIVNESNQPFRINDTTGDLTFGPYAMRLDSSTGNVSYQLIIKASEVVKPNDVQLGETTATTLITITVIDLKSINA